MIITDFTSIIEVPDGSFDIEVYEGDTFASYPVNISRATIINLRAWLNRNLPEDARSSSRYLETTMSKIDHRLLVSEMEKATKLLREVDATKPPSEEDFRLYEELRAGASRLLTVVTYILEG